MLTLKTLALEPMHACGIGVRLDEISRGVFQVNAGSLFPALRRLERDGLIRGSWRATESNRRAKFYALTASGRTRRCPGDDVDPEVVTLLDDLIHDESCQVPADLATIPILQAQHDVAGTTGERDGSVDTVGLWSG